MTGHEIDQPCDLIINMHIQSVVTSPSNEQEGSVNKMSSRKGSLSYFTVLGNI